MRISLKNKIQVNKDVFFRTFQQFQLMLISVLKIVVGTRTFYFTLCVAAHTLYFYQEKKTISNKNVVYSANMKMHLI